VSAVGGIGWLHEFDSKDNSLTAKTGLDLAFNLGKAKAVSIVVSPGVYWNLNRGGKIEFNKHNAQLAVMGSLVYHFKTSNGTHHFKTYDVGAMIDEINRLNEELAKKPNEVVKIVEKKVEVPATDAVSVADKNGETWIVTFATGSAKLTREAKFILNQVGNDAIVNVTATASPDGSAKFNQKLSEKRASIVADYLAKKGIKVNSSEGIGSVNDSSNRIAIITSY
jgi:outer membrane protein OmpA-like peptidoglycan-associated protein